MPPLGQINRKPIVGWHGRSVIKMLGWRYKQAIHGEKGIYWIYTQPMEFSVSPVSKLEPTLLEPYSSPYSSQVRVISHVAHVSYTCCAASYRQLQFAYISKEQGMSSVKKCNGTNKLKNNPFSLSRLVMAVLQSAGLPALPSLLGYSYSLLQQRPTQLINY